MQMRRYLPLLIGAAAGIGPYGAGLDRQTIRIEIEQSDTAACVIGDRQPISAGIDGDIAGCPTVARHLGPLVPLAVLPPISADRADRAFVDQIMQRVTRR